MAAWSRPGVADRARDRIGKLIYLDAFVPQDGQAFLDFLPREVRQKMLDGVKSGDGWRVQPNPTPSDTSPADVQWITERRLPQSVKCFEQPLGLQAGLTLPRAYIACLKYRRPRSVRSILRAIQEGQRLEASTTSTPATARTSRRRKHWSKLLNAVIAAP